MTVRELIQKLRKMPVNALLSEPLDISLDEYGEVVITKQITEG